jgi:predicted phage replisome organizer|nr:MAG TPA: Replication initiation and membrane attachment [Bacteriophage sp.]
MAEKKYYWLKLPRNFFGKHYIKILRAKENGELLVLFYMWMLTEAIDHEGRLRYSEDIPYDEEMLAEASGFALHIVTQALQQFTKLQLVITESDGTLFMPKSIEMIGSESASAQRVREYRERKNSKEKKPETVENTESNDNVTKCNSDVQKSNIEKELEKELEKENKKGGKRETTQSIFERLLPEYTISDVMADKLREWFKYKTERKDGYKEQGMKSLLKQVANKVSVYGDTAVCNLIDECMSNGWKGIIWDKLQSSSAYRNSGDRIGNRVKDVDGW